MATSNVSLLLEQTQQFQTKENINHLLHTVQSSYSSNTEGLSRPQAESMLKLITKNIGLRDEHNRRRLDFKAFQVLELFHFLLFSDTQFRQLVGEQTIESLRLSYLHRYLEEDVLEKYKQFAAEIVQFLRANFTQFENYKLYINVRYLEELETRLKAIEQSEAHPQLPRVEKNFTESMLSIPFYNLPPKAVVELVKVNPETGLSEAEAESRRKRYGPNEIAKPVHTSALVILLHQLTDFIAAILIITAIVAALMGDVKASVVLMLVIVFNITVGFVQEYKAERALESLEQLDVQHASVQRDSSIEVIKASDLVPGDIVVLEEGMQVPADLRLIECSSLSVLESILTGESVPVDKQIDEIEERDVAIGDRTNMAYMSTTVTRGRAKGVVVATGKATEVGKISRNLAETTKRKTPLEEKLQKLGYIFVALSFGLCAVVVVVGILRGNEWQEMIKTGVSLAVSVIPDGLVAATTVTMSLGVQRMAKKNAIVRQLPAVETLGSITVICSDKTGTLTEGKMNLAGIWVPGNNIYHLSTKEAHAAVYLNNQQINSASIPEELSKIFWVLALCNNATVKDSEGSPSSPDEPTEVIGDPTEVAFEVAARKIGLHKEEWINKHGFKYVQEFPFDSERKRMSVIYEYTVEEARCKLVLSKGAPESMLTKGICNRIQIRDEIFPLKENIVKYLEQKHTKLSSRGLRVLALAYKELSAEESKSKLHDADVEKDLIFLGFAGLVDSPRAGVQQSIQVCKEAGIKVVMITGDHPLTARSIASSLGIISDDPSQRVLRGKDIDELAADNRLHTLQPFPQVFARVSPDNKLQIVQTLQKQGEVVSMIGDGVNDATSIRRSDVGVCMGKSGTDVAKQAASIILTDDNFSTIVNAIKEGRRIYDNIEKFVMYLLSCNLAEVLLMLAAVMIGTPVPFTPIQILYANLVADTPPAFCLGIEKEDPDIMNRKPRNPKSNIFTIYGWVITAYYGVVMSGLTYAGMLMSLYYDKESLEKTRSFTFALLIVIQLAHAFHCKSTTFSVFHKSLMSNVWLVAAVAGAFFLLVIGHYVPFLSHTLQLLPLTTYDWIKIAIGVALHTALVEVVKLFLRYRKRIQSERQDERFFSEL